MNSPVRVFLLVVLLLALAGGTSWAIEIATSIPGDAPQESPVGFIANLYQFALLIGGLLAFGMLVYGGIKYIVSAGNPSAKSDAKDAITQALLGLLLLLGAYLVLFVINPELVTLELPELEQVKAVDSGGHGDTIGGRCESCVNGRCDADLSCSSRNQCVPTGGCCTDTDCQIGKEQCENNTCVEIQTTTECENRSECGQLACVDNNCQPCTTAQQCGGSGMCSANGLCLGTVYGSCNSDSDCRLNTQNPGTSACYQGRCYNKCGSCPEAFTCTDTGQGFSVCL